MYLAASPVKVVQTQPGHLRGPYSIGDQKHQDGVIPHALFRRAIDGLKNSLNLLGVKESRLRFLPVDPRPGKRLQAFLKRMTLHP
jgi:hypothetical protein